MKTLGMYMAIAGLASIVLYFMNMQLTLLMWIDNWGETTGWIIRGGLVVVGAALFLMGPDSPDPEEKDQA